jgi:mono/diheme cytochrome c family protein
LVQRGAYLARVGNCALCHTTSSGASYAGGKAIATPFGEIYSSNLTPDMLTGLGQWTANDFWRALHDGISKDGRRLYPAFPYTSYTRVTRDDSDALFAYLRTLAPVYQTHRAHALRWPYSEQWALKIWQGLFFAPDDAIVPAPTSEPPRTALWKRGEYLVNGLGHCGACHTPRNRFGGETAALLGGAHIPGRQAYAPSLRDPQEAGLAQWSTQEIVALLHSGVAPKGSTSGLMSEVVQHSTQYLTVPDAQAMAEYLRSLPTQISAGAVLRTPVPEAQAFIRQGGKLYEKHCAECHGTQGQGRPGAYPALAGSRFVTAAHTVNLVQIVRQGGFTPSTAVNPRPFGMPPFQLLLNNRELASVLTYIRSSWGNRADAVSEFEVEKGS